MSNQSTTGLVSIGGADGGATAPATDGQVPAEPVAVFAVPWSTAAQSAATTPVGVSPFLLLLIGLGVVSMVVFIGPAARRSARYWLGEARFALVPRARRPD